MEFHSFVICEDSPPPPQSFEILHRAQSGHDNNAQTRHRGSLATKMHGVAAIQSLGKNGRDGDLLGLEFIDRILEVSEIFLLRENEKSTFLLTCAAP